MSKGSNERLIQSAREGNVDGLRASIASGADVNTKNEGGWPALLIAVNSGHHLVVKELICFGADVDGKSPSGHSPLAFAIRDNDAEMLSLLIREGATLGLSHSFEPNPIAYAAFMGSEQCIVRLMEAGASWKELTIDGIDLLQYAKNRSLKIVQAEIERHEIGKSVSKHNVGDNLGL